jgi:sugar/nucleoside kinase (ribokinase family)
VDQAVVASGAILYLEGYLFDRAEAKAAFQLASKIAHDAGRTVSLTLSDSFCVDRHRREFRQLLDSHVDLLFANEPEICSLYEVATVDEAIVEVRKECDVAVITRGAAGSVIVSGEELIEVPAEPVEHIVDTTGAGDLFAAGFLFGRVRGLDLATCGRLGSLAAAEVISHVGARPEVSLADFAKDLLA